MGNRAYLYAFDRFESGMPLRPRALHHWRNIIPISFLLLLSGKPRPYRSSIYENSQDAIISELEQGCNRLLHLLRLLEESGKVHGIHAARRETEKFLTPLPGRFVLLEPTEIFWFEQTPHQAQQAKLIAQIVKLAQQVDRILTQPPAQLFTRAPVWLTRLRADWSNELAVEGWSALSPFMFDS